jgi:hypothetical protein
MFKLEWWMRVSLEQQYFVIVEGEKITLLRFFRLRLDCIVSLEKESF